MISLKIDMKAYNMKWLDNELDHIRVLIEQGYTEGDGWSLTGTAEAEPKVEEVEEKLPEEIIEK